MKRASVGMAALWLACAAGCSGTTGPAGQPGTQGTKGDPGTKGEQGTKGDNLAPALGAVAPLTAYLEHTTTVEISGVGTAWTDATKVDFGMGVTVDKVVAATPTALVVTVTAKDPAAIGAHDITVDDGKTPLSFKGAFAVAAPLVADTVKGNQALGSILQVRAVQKDLATPFDSATQLGLSSNSPGQVVDGGPYSLQAAVFIDVKATPGMADLVATSADMTPVVSRALNAVTIVDRKPTPLMANTAVAGKAGNPYDSQLFQLDLGDNQIATLTVSSKDPKASPAFALLPSSGAFKDVLGYGPSKTISNPKKDSYYVVFWDAKGGNGYDFTLTPGVGATEVEPNDAYMTATGFQAGLVAFGAIGPATDADYFSVALNSGQTITATTKAGQTDTCGGTNNGKIDSQLTLYNTNGTTVMQQNDDINGANNYCSSVTQVIGVTGSYFLKVRNSPSFCSNCTFNYSLEVVIK